MRIIHIIGACHTTYERVQVDESVFVPLHACHDQYVKFLWAIFKLVIISFPEDALGLGGNGKMVEMQ